MRHPITSVVLGLAFLLSITACDASPAITATAVPPSTPAGATVSVTSPLSAPTGVSPSVTPPSGSTARAGVVPSALPTMPPTTTGAGDRATRAPGDGVISTTGVNSAAGTPTAFAPAGISPAARAYLESALDIMQQHVLHPDRLDWATIRQLAFDGAQTAQTPADTYAAIQRVIPLLKDRHAQFMTPSEAAQVPLIAPDTGLGVVVAYPERSIAEVITGTAAVQAGIQVGDQITRINGLPTAGLAAAAFYTALFGGTSTTVTLQRARRPDPLTVTLPHGDYQYSAYLPTGERLPDNIGYLNLPRVRNEDPWVRQYALWAQQTIRDIDQPATCG